MTLAVDGGRGPRAVKMARVDGIVASTGPRHAETMAALEALIERTAPDAAKKNS